LLIINKLRALKFCPIFKIISRRWILSQGNGGRENQSVSKIGEKVTQSICLYWDLVMMKK